MTLLNSVLLRVRSREWLVNEFWRTFRYGVVGVTSLLVHAGMYALLSRVLWENGNRTLQYVIALVTAAFLNFTGHRLWTFAVNHFSAFMLARYIMGMVFGMVLQSLIFHLVYETMGYPDTIAFVVSVVISILFSYFIHRFFTYNLWFERRFGTLNETVIEETIVEDTVVQVEIE